MALQTPRTLLMGLAALIALGLGTLPAEAARPQLSPKVHRDPVHHFSLKTFRDWKPVPLQARETIQVAKFVPAKGAQGPSLAVVRIDKRRGAGQPTVTGRPRAATGRPVADRPTSAWAATIGRLRIPEAKQPDPKEGRAVRSRDKVEGRLWSFEVPIHGRTTGLFVSLATFERDDVEYGVFFTAPADKRRTYQRHMKSLARSFRFFDKRAGEVETIRDLTGVNISAARRRQIEKSMVDGWDVKVSRQKNYIVVYNTMGSRNHVLAKEIASRVELIRKQVFERQFPPAKPIDAVAVVRVCGDRAEYHAYGGPAGSAGYWNSGSEELVFYDASPSKKVDDDTLSVLYHEAFHQYIHYSSGNLAPHIWFNEGHGDYYAGAKLKGRTFRIAKFEWRRGIIKSAVRQGPRKQLENEDGRARFANDGGYTPLADLLVMTQSEYYAYAGVSYAQGWSFVYFLREIVPKNRRYRAKWGRILDTYFDTLQQETSRTSAPSRRVAQGGAAAGRRGSAQAPRVVHPRQAALDKALDAAFRGVDVADLEAAWLKSVGDDM